MDQEELLLSLSILTDKTKLIQSDINKIQDDVFTIQENGTSAVVADVVSEDSEEAVSGKAVFEFVNQQISSGGSSGGTGGGVTLATGTFSADDTANAVSGKQVADYIDDKNF